MKSCVHSCLIHWFKIYLLNIYSVLPKYLGLNTVTHATEQNSCSSRWLGSLAPHRHLDWRQTSRVNRQERVTVDICARDKQQGSTPGDGGRKPAWCGRDTQLRQAVKGEAGGLVWGSCSVRSSLFCRSEDLTARYCVRKCPLHVNFFLTLFNPNLPGRLDKSLHLSWTWFAKVVMMKP